MQAHPEGRFQKSTLSNGVRVVTENHSDSRAASLGIWVLSGTRDENSKEAGISHFLEHLVFKGTKTRSPYQIVKALEQLGGELNAFTTREYTCYHALVLKDHWHLALDVLTDLVANMDLKKSDFELERSVILQEIAMGEDSQEELIYDLYFDAAYGRHSVGRPILGNIKSIKAMALKQVKDRYATHYSGPNLIVSAVGQLDHQEFTAEVEKLLRRKKKARLKVRRTPPKHLPIRVAIEKPGEQLHLLMGLPVASFKDEYRFEAFIVNALLGGGMTSRLYQKVREQKGLVYTIYSQLNTFIDSGLITIYAACESKNMPAVMKSVQIEIMRLAEKGVRKSDIDLFKTQVKGSLLLGSDDVENRMNSIAINEIVFGEYRSVESVIAEIDAISPASVAKFMSLHYRPENFGVMLVGAGAEGLKGFVAEYKLG